MLSVACTEPVRLEPVPGSTAIKRSEISAEIIGAPFVGFTLSHEEGVGQNKGAKRGSESVRTLRVDPGLRSTSEPGV